MKMVQTVDLTEQISPELRLADRAPVAHVELDDAWRGPSEKLARMDRHTKVFLKMVRSAIGDWKAKMPSAADVEPPQISGVVPSTDLPFGGLLLPTQDEDWPDQGIVRSAVLRMLRSGLFPMRDDDSPWDSAEEAKRAFEEALPANEARVEPNHHWDEMESDEAMSRLAFAGLGALRLLPVTEPDSDGVAWVSDMAFMSAFDVRPGFERYGAIAYFDSEQRPVRIHWCHAHRDVYPGDPDWSHAKWVWRCTLLVGSTVTDHLVGVHWLIGNYVTYSARSFLSTDHPLRRLLKPFTWRTITINYNATYSLCPERGFVHRATALKYDAMLTAMGSSVDLIQFRTVPELIARKGAGAMGDAFPWATDALALYEVIYDFVADYVDVYFAGDAVTRDSEVQAFWESVQSASDTVGIPALTKDHLLDVLAQFIWCVTGMHEAVGSVQEYVIDPRFMGTKIRPGREMSDVQASMQCLGIIGLTSLEMPKLLDDYGHVCLDAKGRACFDRFRKELVSLAECIDVANLNRRWPCNTFNPRFLEVAVAI